MGAATFRLPSETTFAAFTGAAGAGAAGAGAAFGAGGAGAAGAEGTGTDGILAAAGAPVVKPSSTVTS